MCLILLKTFFFFFTFTPLMVKGASTKLVWFQMLEGSPFQRMFVFRMCTTSMLMIAHSIEQLIPSQSLLAYGSCRPQGFDLSYLCFSFKSALHNHVPAMRLNNLLGGMQMHWFFLNLIAQQHQLLSISVFFFFPGIICGNVIQKNKWANVMRCDWKHLFLWYSLP